MIGQPDDPSQAVRRASLVEQVELLEAKHTRATPCEVGGGGAPHASQTNDDRVVAHAVMMAAGSTADAWRLR